MRHPATPLVALVDTPWESSAGRTRELLLRAAATRPVVVVENASEGDYSALSRSSSAGGVRVIRPSVPAYLSALDAGTVVAEILAALPELAPYPAVDLWVGDPMLVPYADYLPVRLTVVDFADDGEGALAGDVPLPLRVRDLLNVADVVFVDSAELLARIAGERADARLVLSAAGGEWDGVWADMDRTMEAALRERCAESARPAPAVDEKIAEQV